MDSILKALSVWHLISLVLAQLEADGIVPSPANVASATHELINARIDSGHLPANFRDGSGSIVADAIAVHPEVDNALVHPPLAK